MFLESHLNEGSVLLRHLERPRFVRRGETVVTDEAREHYRPEPAFASCQEDLQLPIFTRDKPSVPEEGLDPFEGRGESSGRFLSIEEYSIPPLPQLAHDLQGIVPRP
jgi:hypothetical protein